jgi:hypothetical protein
MENDLLNQKYKLEDLTNQLNSSNIDKNFYFSKLTNIEEYVSNFDMTKNPNLLKHAVLKLI